MLPVIIAVVVATVIKGAVDIVDAYEKIDEAEKKVERNRKKLEDKETELKQQVALLEKTLTNIGKEYAILIFNYFPRFGRIYKAVGGEFKLNKHWFVALENVRGKRIEIRIKHQEVKSFIKFVQEEQFQKTLRILDIKKYEINETVLKELGKILIFNGLGSILASVSVSTLSRVITSQVPIQIVKTSLKSILGAELSSFVAGGALGELLGSALGVLANPLVGLSIGIFVAGRKVQAKAEEALTEAEKFEKEVQKALLKVQPYEMKLKELNTISVNHLKTVKYVFGLFKKKVEKIETLYDSRGSYYELQKEIDNLLPFGAYLKKLVHNPLLIPSNKSFLRIFKNRKFDLLNLSVSPEVKRFIKEWEVV